MTGVGQNNKTMKPTNLLITAIVSGGLAFGVAAQAKEHEEENINTSDVPAEVQKAAETEAHGGKIWVESSGCDPDKLPGSEFIATLPVTAVYKQPNKL